MIMFCELCYRLPRNLHYIYLTLHFFCNTSVLFCIIKYNKNEIAKKLAAQIVSWENEPYDKDPFQFFSMVCFF